MEVRVSQSSMNAGRRSLATAMAVVFACAGTRGATAQTRPADPPATPQSPKPAKKPDPATDPSLNDPSLDDDILGKGGTRKPPTVPLATSPTVPDSASKDTPAPVPPVGSLSSGGPGVPVGTFLPEGTFLSASPGAIVRSPGGTYLFVPAVAGPGLAKVVPMVLLPNQRLSQVASAFDSGETAIASSVSGQTFVYRGRQHLLLSVFSMSHESTASAKPKSTPGVDSDVKSMMEELDARPSAPRALDQRILSTTSDRTAKDNVIAEGTVVVGRRARLIRGGGGLVAMFDNGPGNPGLPAMPLLPCRLLEQLDSLAASRGENLTLKISGRTTVHQGRNYLLPTMYQVIRPGDIKPMQ